MAANEKLNQLRKIIRGYGSAAIAFSGGVDSTFLLKIAAEELGSNAVAVTAQSSTYPEREYMETVAFAKSLGIRQIVIESEELDIPEFADNPVDRCYYCKNELFGKIMLIAKDLKLYAVLDGTNADDTGDYRPGMQAIYELGIKSPLLDVGLTKAEIRELSHEMELPTWDKQPFACLASRFPYGQHITREKLSMVDRAEQILLDLGFRQVRVRHHGDLARIEVGPKETGRFADEEFAARINSELKQIGFTYVALDLAGYRTGSMNEALHRQEVRK